MLATLPLAGTNRLTTRLGFGCSSLMGSMGRAESLRTLEWAYDAGVRHFDVAPAYGYGQAEVCLGEFLARHNDATVTTKFGIPPAKNPGLIGVARRLARPLIKALPGLKKKAQQAASAVAAAPAARDLSAAKAKASLEASLRNLRVQRIDVFLLHDATPAELNNNEDLLRFLEDARQQGLIGDFGCGTDRPHAVGILAQSPAFARVLQREWSVFNGPDADPAFHIYHRSLAHNRIRLEAFLKANPQTARQWSDHIGADLLAPGALPPLMMRAALAVNPAAITLFSSKSRDNIRANAQLAEPNPSEETKAQALYTLVQQNLASIGEAAA